jgi:hypothetical protein
MALAFALPFDGAMSTHIETETDFVELGGWLLRLLTVIWGS